MTSHENRAAAISRTWAVRGEGDYHYYASVEESAAAFWDPGTLFRSSFDHMDHRVVLEIACGVGRHANQVLGGPFEVQRYIATDTSPDALDDVRLRLGADPRLEVVQVEGDAGLPDDLTGVTAVFSYDSMVHFELITLWAYLQQIERVLIPGGLALLHHSNYADNPEGNFQDNPGWRNFMTASTFRYLASRAGLVVEQMTVIDWAVAESDALTLLRKPS